MSDVTHDKHDETTGKFAAEYSAEDFVDAVAALDLPTTSDVADAVGCAHRTALHHLNRLAEEGRLDSRMAGRAKLWRVVEDVQDAGVTPDAGAEAVTPDRTREAESAAESDVVDGDIVDAVAEAWDDTGDRLAARKAAARAVLDYAREHGTVSKQEAKEKIRPEYPVDGQNARTWYRKNIRPVLNEAAEYDNSARAYRLVEE
ncbi:hypothetical protein [Haloplanus natans]|uniref:hypothetical protein n=1 Tax=Haloplanus natans TaxID=376171 RepID=UPI001B7FDA73|nr:hypothetical protein [Haloplanus natans]